MQHKQAAETNRQIPACQEYLFVCPNHETQPSKPLYRPALIHILLCWRGKCGFD